MTIGSLVWDESETRRSWWAERLAMDRRTKIRVPIRYGRHSANRGGCYTMVFDAVRQDRLGTAWVIPALRAASTVQDLLVEARCLATAEGMSSTCTSWAAIGLWSKPDQLSETDRAAWRAGAVTDEALHEQLRVLCPIAPDSSIQLPWPSFVDATRSQDFDVLLAALTKPQVHGEAGDDAPSADEIVRCMSSDATNKGFEYFTRNRIAGVSTFQDDAIIAGIRRDPRLAKMLAALEM